MFDAAVRCRCRPSWRGRRRNPARGQPEWQKPVVKDRSEVLTWLAAGEAARGYALDGGATRASFEDIGDLATILGVPPRWSTGCRLR